MRIISRKVTTMHSKEEIFQIMKASASRRKAANFTGNCFHILFPNRWHTRMGFIPVKGTINDQNGFTEVCIEIHGGFTFYIGVLFFFAGILLITYELFTSLSYIYYALICFGISILVYIIDLCDGIICLDSLEHRLSREISK